MGVRNSGIHFRSGPEEQEYRVVTALPTIQRVIQELKMSIQDVKNLLTKTKEAGEDFDLAFFEWRSAPTSQGVSPAQLFFGRMIRSCVLPQLLEIPDKQKDAEERMINEQENRFRRFTRHPLPLLIRDQKVWLRDRLTKRCDIPAEVRGCFPNGKSYILQTNQGGVFFEK